MSLIRWMYVGNYYEGCAQTSNRETTPLSLAAFGPKRAREGKVWVGVLGKSPRKATGRPLGRPRRIKKYLDYSFTHRAGRTAIRL